MANLSLRHICKIYPARGGAKKSLFNFKKKAQPEQRTGDFIAVKDFNMEIEDGEFIVFVGPSGCGKSTTLRMIAGLEDISAGEMYIDGRLVNNVDAKDRDIAMVFQSYALYPHMTSYENISFGLKMRKIPDVKRDKEGNPVIAIDTNKIKELQSTLNGFKKELCNREVNEICDLFDTCIEEKQNELKERIELQKQNGEADADGIAAIKQSIKNLKTAKAAAVSARRQNSEELMKQAAEQAAEAGADLNSIADNKIKEGLRQNIQSVEKEIEYYSETPVQINYLRHYTKDEIDEKVQWAAGILGIKELLQSKPSDMSGGQRQRIALGRAMVRGPKVFLLDEPLSNLDAKLRTTMRSEIVKLHKALKTTFIYVTHDQVEAMTMGSRIVVMKDGYIQQIDTPTNLFDYPENKFVAGFIGTPQMNFFRVSIVKQAKNLEATFANGEKVSLSLNKLRPVKEEYLDGQPHEAYLGVRGEHIQVGQSGLSVNINITEVLGSDMHVFFGIEGEESDFIACINERASLSGGDKIHIKFEEKNVHLFDIETEKSILGKAEK